MAAQPERINDIKPSFALPGGADSRLAAEVIYHLQWTMEDGDSALTRLKSEGYTALIKQIQETIAVRYGGGVDVAAELAGHLAAVAKSEN